LHVILVSSTILMYSQLAYLNYQNAGNTARYLLSTLAIIQPPHHSYCTYIFAV